jgi:hypothetical protein
LTNDWAKLGAANMFNHKPNLAKQFLTRTGN